MPKHLPRFSSGHTDSHCRVAALRPWRVTILKHGGTWKGEISQLPTPNVYRSPTSQGGRGGLLGVSVWELDKRQSVGSRELSQYAPINASMFRLGIVNASLPLQLTLIPFSAWRLQDRCDPPARSDE